MTQNEQLVHTFYTCFQNKDYKGMQACYTGDAYFSDPVFPNLNTVEVKSMWEMFCSRGKFISLEFSNVKADGHKGSAEWIATYEFSSTGKTVRNHIFSSFIFENNMIRKHIDSFDFYAWARQAFGITGLLLGWTPFFKNKVRSAARKNLYEFIRKKA